MKTISSISLDEMEIRFDQDNQNAKKFDYLDEISEATTTDAGG